jgi:hypothetical protein
LCHQKMRRFARRFSSRPKRLDPFHGRFFDAALPRTGVIRSRSISRNIPAGKGSYLGNQPTSQA